jgi:hypothetical protein
MRQALLTLDRILRGDATRPDQMHDGQLPLPAVKLTVLLLLLAAFYGATMGTFAMLRPEGPEWRQVLASAGKVPALFFLSLMITFPSIYVFSAIMRSPLRAPALASLMLAALSVSIAVLASLGPIEAFFALSTTSYPFMILLSVAFCGSAGLLGVRFLLQTMQRLANDPRLVPPPPPPLPRRPNGDDAAWHPDLTSDTPEPEPPAILPTVSRATRMMIRVWVLMYAVVGMQMAWILRPFIGQPGQPFSLFRERHSNFFESVWGCLRELLG